MSYLSSMPSHYCPAPISHPYYAPHPSSSFFSPSPTHSLTLLLATSLSHSLQAYQRCSPSQTASQHSSPLPIHPEHSSALNGLTTPEKKAQEFNHPTKSSPLHSQSTLSPSPCLQVPEPDSKKRRTPVTDDQLPVDSKEALSKKAAHKKGSKKVKAESDLVVEVPTVSLIEAAAAPCLSLGRKELKEKWEELMSRKVGDWSELMKSSKPKRELRMLAN